MAVFKRVICTNCKNQVAQIAKENINLEDYKCPKCNGESRLSSKWYVSTYLINGLGQKLKYTKSIGTKKDAEAYERQMLTQRDGGETHERKNKVIRYKNIADCFNLWIEQKLIEKTISVQTARTYRNRINQQLLPAFGHIAVKDITYSLLDEYKVKRLSECEVATLNLDIAIMRRSFTIAIRKQIIKNNPLQYYEMVKGKREKDRYLSDEEIASLLQECKSSNPRLYVMVMLALNTGLRIDGVLGMRWEYINWEKREIARVVKGNKLIRIPINDKLNAVLKSWQNRDGVTRVSGFLFYLKSDKEKRLPIAYDIGFQSACKKTNIKDCTFHTLRHTFATHFLEQNPDKIEILMRILGHSSEYMSRKYAHITDRAKHDVMANFSIC